MKIKKLLTRVFALLLAVVSFGAIQAQTVTGTVTDSAGSAIAGASVVVKNSNVGTSTDATGKFTIKAASNATLVITSVGFGTEEIAVGGKTDVSVTLQPGTQSNLNEVVVVGYGTSRKRDLTGSVASIQAKDFNKGVITNPDQLLQGKVAGLQVINSSGQPGAATIVKIRGNNSIRSGNTPLYVIDGVPLDGRNARPGVINSGIGALPDVNPLLFINPADIASIDVLKDASSAAIYGSRGANGVVLVTTKKGSVGAARVEVGSYVSIGNVRKRIEMLDANEYRSALTTYNAKSDSGASVDPFGEITRTAITQNYTVAFSGGSDNGRYRASFLAYDQEGIIRKSNLKKYVGNFNGQYRLLDKKLSFDYNITAANVAEQIAPVSNDAGSNGNLISLALIWNPTLVLKRSNGLYNQRNPSGQVNPLAISDAYNDYANTTTLLGSLSVGYKIFPDLEYRVLYGINYGSGNRKQEIQGWISGTGSNADGQGAANIGSSQLFSQTLTHTLNYNKKVSADLNISALVGYEYWTTKYQGNQSYVFGFDLNKSQLSVLPDYHYYDNMQAGKQGNLQTFAFKDPSVELQSYFGRAVINFKDKYLLTGTLRTDGSSKFGKNNRYALFPSVAAAWNISDEDFMSGSTFFTNLKLRIGYGETGNQEFNPVDAALPTGIYNAFNSINSIHYGNDDLKWETVSSVNAGLDFTIKKGRLFGSIDYFSKKTNNPILDFAISQPTAGTGTIYKNLDGEQAQKGWVTNKGVEVLLGGVIVQQKSITWNASVNATYFKNRVLIPELAGVPFVKFTGALNGQGSSGAYSQVIAHDQPVNVFYLRTFQGFDKDGIGIYSNDPGFVADPNPKLFMGFSTDATYKKVTVSAVLNAGFGNKIYNNTAMSVTNISNIVGGRNIAKNLIGNGEKTANAITPSTRFLENGSFVKLNNLNVSYAFGNLGRFVKGANVYLTGNNLFVITKYTGFDPEVNVDKALNGIPSLGVDYIGYPSVRSFVLGINFSL